MYIVTFAEVRLRSPDKVVVEDPGPLHRAEQGSRSIWSKGNPAQSRSCGRSGRAPLSWYHSGIPPKWSFFTKGAARHTPRPSRAYRHRLTLFCLSVRICGDFVSLACPVSPFGWGRDPMGSKLKSAISGKPKQGLDELADGESAQEAGLLRRHAPSITGGQWHHVGANRHTQGRCPYKNRDDFSRVRSYEPVTPRACTITHYARIRFTSQEESAKNCNPSVTGWGLAVRMSPIAVFAPVTDRLPKTAGFTPK